ncbi:MAG: class I SAM-dependent methyltransferase [bacterium]|nr:class I SAM-dependent methyltransferase [bacterium]
MLRSLFTRLKSGTEYLNYGRDIIRHWGADLYEESEASAGLEAFRVLDLGCGHGEDLRNIRAEVEERAEAEGERNSVSLLVTPRVELHGVEGYAPYVAECRAAGIQTHALNIERDPFPGPSASYDLIVANQILEHTKEIFWIFAEVARLLKPGGRFIAGVPNLASFHNRLLLMFGQQPTQIKSMSAHVRGFTKPDMREFAETGGLFRLIGFRGSNFYPLPPFLSKPLARLFPTLAWGSFYLLERTEADGDFLKCLTGDDNFLETPFYGSPQNPAPTRRASGGPASRKSTGSSKKAGAKKTSALPSKKKTAKAGASRSKKKPASAAAKKKKKAGARR